MVVFQMRKMFIILFALLLSAVFVEIIINNIVGYPKVTGQRKFVYATHINNNEMLKWKSPFTKYWTVEGGNRVFSYNNIGLPGADVHLEEKSKIIFVLGDSFLEAMQVPPEKMSVSVFADLLRNTDTNYKPINLGASNNDAYVLWFRANFYEKYYKPDYVCLMVTCLEVLDLNFLNHTYPFNFSLPDNFGAQIPEGKLEKSFNVFRKQFASVNLVTNGFKVFNSSQKETPLTISESSEHKTYNKDVEFLKECLGKFKDKYGDKFFVVSIEPEEENNKLLSAACDSLNIKYARKNLLVEENIVKGGSHLNELGNLKLGELFNDTFVKFYKK
jgi:hypothetical protein